jgi:hypothetical protein
VVLSLWPRRLAVAVVVLAGQVGTTCHATTAVVKTEGGQRFSESSPQVNRPGLTWPCRRLWLLGIVRERVTAPCWSVLGNYVIC